jgi:hypothetical protein
MGRQVIKAPKDRGGVRGPTPAPGTEDAYLERLFKLIPSETIAVYLFIEGVLLSAFSGADQQSQLTTWLWVILVILLIGNFFYLRRLQGVTDPAQHVILALALIVWVFTIGGPFQYLSFYQPFMGAVVLGLFTFFVPIFYTGVSVNQ